MTDNIRKAEEGESRDRDTIAEYRCVCGQMILLDGGPAECASCGRRYDSAVFRDAASETTLFHDHSAGESATFASKAQQTEIALVGRRLGHFKIIGHIGSGGMGSVYRALDESLQRYVALKVIRSAPGGTSEAVLERLFQEARAQARVNHPHVAHIYYVGNEEDTPFLAMELVGESTLADRLQDGPLPFKEVIRYGLQMAQALEHAARYDIVHGDIKPSNVLLVDANTVKISDFGLASRLSKAAGTPSTTGGTPDYMPPEAVEGREVDHRGDMYSLGVALFEMTFGRLPYDTSSTNVQERLRMHREAAVQFPEAWPPGLPQSWRDVLTTLLDKDPDQRYDDFDGLIRDLLKHQPVDLPNASPLLRGLAWLFDGFLVSSPLVIVELVLSDVLPLLSALVEVAIGLGICFLQARWGTTPGKRLFQIRIVDQHGLTPGRSVLATRAIFQFVWVWSTAFGHVMDLVRLPIVGGIVGTLVGIFILTEMLFVLFGKGRSLHDRLLRTRVVLNA